jgi:flagellar biosynthesis/type III secretory pathway chaperone
VGAQELSALLWRERELLELLTFKLEEEQLLLTSGRTRWVQHATREVEQVMGGLRITGLARSVEVAEVAAEWGTGEGATLRELVAHAPVGPWSEIFGGHLRALTDLTGEIKQLRDVNEQFLRAAMRTTQELLAGTDGEPRTYDAHGASDHASQNARLFDARL